MHNIGLLFSKSFEKPEYNDLVDRLEQLGIIKLQARILKLELEGTGTSKEKVKLLLLKGDLKRRISRLKRVQHV